LFTNSLYLSRNLPINSLRLSHKDSIKYNKRKTKEEWQLYKIYRILDLVDWYLRGKREEKNRWDWLCNLSMMMLLFSFSIDKYIAFCICCTKFLNADWYCFIDLYLSLIMVN
jgi:hypothetical protein